MKNRPSIYLILFFFGLGVVFTGLILFIGRQKEERRQLTYLHLAFENRQETAGLWQKNLRNKLIELAGASFENPQGKILEVIEEQNKGGYLEKKFQMLFFSQGQDRRVFCWLATPQKSKEKLPAVVFIPGHGEGVVELLEKEGSYQQATARYLAENGLMTLTCEPWAFWESAENPYQLSVAVNRALLEGRSVMGIFMDQTRAEVSLLRSLPEVSQEKIGIAGVSFGGAVSFYAAAVDERITASYIAGFLTTFEKTYFNYQHSTEMIIPGIYRFIDIPDLAGLIAPRYVMFDNQETNNSLAMTADDAETLVNSRVKPIFENFGAQDKVLLNKGEQGHILDKEAALEFFTMAFYGD